MVDIHIEGRRKLLVPNEECRTSSDRRVRAGSSRTVCRKDAACLHAVLAVEISKWPLLALD